MLYCASHTLDESEVEALKADMLRHCFFGEGHPHHIGPNPGDMVGEPPLRWEDQTESDPIVILGHSGSHGMYVTMNESAQKMWGVEQELLDIASQKDVEHSVLENGNGPLFWRLFHPSCWPKMAQVFVETWILDPPSVYMGLNIIRADCRVVKVHSSWKFFYHADGSYLCTKVFLRHK